MRPAVHSPYSRLSQASDYVKLDASKGTELPYLITRIVNIYLRSISIVRYANNKFYSRYSSGIFPLGSILSCFGEFSSVTEIL